MAAKRHDAGVPAISFRLFALSLVIGVVVSTGWDAVRTVPDPDLPLWTDFVCLVAVFVVAYALLARRAALRPAK